MTHQGPAALSRLAGAAAAREGGPSSRLPRVTLVADLVCPWCYLGFARLTALAPAEPFRLAWHPFLLNPHLPPGGVPRAAYLQRRFGGPTPADQVAERAVAAAAAEGITLRLDRIGRQPSTVLAHGLLLRAGGRAPEAARAVYEAFFQGGLDIGAADVMAALGEPFGVGLDAMRGAAAEVAAAHDAACRSGIDGVPLLVFGADHAIAGAQPAAAILALLRLERYRLDGAAAGRAGQGRQAS